MKVRIWMERMVILDLLAVALLLFVRGFPAIMDKKYDLESHPNNKKTKNKKSKG